MLVTLDKFARNGRFRVLRDITELTAAQYKSIFRDLVKKNLDELTDLYDPGAALLT